MKKKKRTPFSPSKRIEELIRSTGLSPYGFSKITDISYSTLEGWLNGDLNMFVSSLQDFCQAFGISEAHFWQEKSEQGTSETGLENDGSGAVFCRRRFLVAADDSRRAETGDRLDEEYGLQSTLVLIVP